MMVLNPRSGSDSHVLNISSFIDNYGDPEKRRQSDASAFYSSRCQSQRCCLYRYSQALN